MIAQSAIIAQVTIQNNVWKVLTATMEVVARTVHKAIAVLEEPIKYHANLVNTRVKSEKRTARNVLKANFKARQEKATATIVRRDMLVLLAPRKIESVGVLTFIAPKEQTKFLLLAKDITQLPKLTAPLQLAKAKLCARLAMLVLVEKDTAATVLECIPTSSD